MKIKVEFDTGISVEGAVTKMIALADKMLVYVATNFNGVDITVEHSSTTKWVVAQCHADMGHKTKLEKSE